MRHDGRRGQALAALALAGAVLACLTLWGAAAPGASAAAGPGSVSGPARTPAVRLETLRLPGAGVLPVGGTGTGRAVVARDATGGDGAAAAGAGAATRDQAAAQGSSAPVGTLDAGAWFRVAAVTCDVPAGDGVTVGLRTSADGVVWGRWLEAPLEVVDEDGRPQAYTDPLWTGAARYVQVRARGSAGAPQALSGVRVVVIDPGAGGLVKGASARRDAADAAPPAPAVRPDAGALAAPAASAAAASGKSAGTPSPPALVTRAEWGADESLRSDAPSYAPVKIAFVHHTASGNGYTQADAPALVRAIYAYHTKSLHWSDIGYNFVVDRFGTIYEGRYGGIDRGVIGAQVGGFNTGSTGISVIGTYTDLVPPAAAVAAVERIVAWKLALGGLDPRGTGVLTCGLDDRYKAGDTVTFPVIAGHRDANFTECPGDKLYALLPAIRADVAQRLSPEPVTATLAASGPFVSPNGDGVADAVDLTGSLSAPADWRLVVRNAAGDFVAAWSGHGTRPAATWMGTAGGARAPDGLYTAELTATTLAGVSDSASVQVTLDTAPPRLTGAAATPSSFSPDGDGQTETVAVAYSPAEACDVQVGILADDGDVVRLLRGWHREAPEEQTVVWDGRIEAKGKLVAAPDGRYRFLIERRDAAGNTARQGVAVTLDRTLGFPTVAPVAFSPNGDGVRDATTVGFKLTRRATVAVQIVLGSKTVRTLELGTLAAGRHSVEWDGRTRSGGVTASGRPTVSVTAKTAFGESVVTAALVVDLYRPRLVASSATTTNAGATVLLSCNVTDPFSETVDLSFAITAEDGHRVGSGHPGRTTVGDAVSVQWKPRSRGEFTVTWHATDRAGNPEAKAAVTTVTVR